MSIVIKNQVAASERSAEELGTVLNLEHRRAIFCYDVQDLAASVVKLFHDLNRDVERWQGDLAAGRNEDIRDELEQAGSEWDGLYRRIESLFGKTDALIVAVEGMGFQFDGKKAFHDAWRELRGIVSFSRTQVAAGLEQVRRGEVRPLGEVWDELWDRPVESSHA